MDNKYHREYNKARYHRIRNEYLEQLGGQCIDCSVEYDLEFDHVDPSTKLFPIGKLLNFSKVKRDEEIKKCVLRCKSCHIIKSVANGDCVSNRPV